MPRIITNKSKNWLITQHVVSNFCHQQFFFEIFLLFLLFLCTCNLCFVTRISSRIPTTKKPEFSREGYESEKILDRTNTDSLIFFFFLRVIDRFHSRKSRLIDETIGSSFKPLCYGSSCFFLLFISSVLCSQFMITAGKVDGKAASLARAGFPII